MKIRFTCTSCGKKVVREVSTTVPPRHVTCTCGERKTLKMGRSGADLRSWQRAKNMERKNDG